MVRLDSRDFAAALPLYRSAPARFPLIGAVLLGEQEGSVLTDGRAQPQQAFVMHAFGFAQLLGEPTAQFEAELQRYLLVDKGFAAPKARLYTPRLPRFLEDERHRSLRSQRQRMVITQGDVRGDVSAEVVAVDASNFARFDERFGMARRFWRTAHDFIRKAHAVVAVHRGEPASICYAAAVADGEAEIDVLTRPQYQRLGLARAVVSRFVQICFERGLAPLWDCFENNAGSMQLSRSVGFRPKGPPYPFFTISK